MSEELSGLSCAVAPATAGQREKDDNNGKRWTMDIDDGGGCASRSMS